MSSKERQRMACFEMVMQGKLSLVQAAVQLAISYRQARRIYKRYRYEGDAGLIHKHRGKTSNRRYKFREQVLWHYQNRYDGFGPTLAAEKLKEEQNISVDHETLRKWLLEAHLWRKTKKRSPYRKQRERRAQFGELVQIDGSFHDWFSNGNQDCLMDMVDDATGKSLAILSTAETTRSVLYILEQWIRQYGIPLALYVDLKNVYVSPKHKGFGHVERACAKLGIRIIKAYSPQAKGRVERKHAVYQDRFVKELRLKNIQDIDQANELLQNGFIENLNRKFEKPARNKESAHLPIDHIDLNQALCFEFNRQVQHDFTFQFQRKIYQIRKAYGSHVRPKIDVVVRKHLDGSISAWYKNEQLNLKILKNRPHIQKTENKTTQKLTQSEYGRLSKNYSSWGNINALFFKHSTSKKHYPHYNSNRGHF